MWSVVGRRVGGPNDHNILTPYSDLDVLRLLYLVILLKRRCSKGGRLSAYGGAGYAYVGWAYVCVRTGYGAIIGIAGM